MITIRRVYDNEEPGEHYRVLVDRLWPRGIKKEHSGWNEWVKDLAPSNDLRKWFNHDPSKWDKFRQKYRDELKDKQDELKRLRLLEVKYGNLTLLYSSKEKIFNNAVALSEFISQSDK